MALRQDKYIVAAHYAVVETEHHVEGRQVAADVSYPTLVVHPEEAQLRVANEYLIPLEERWLSDIFHGRVHI